MPAPLTLPTIAMPSEKELALLKILDEGQAFHIEGNYWQAERRYRRVLEKEPNHPRATALMGLLQHARGDNKRALEILDKASANDLNDAMIQQNRAAVLYANGQLLESIEAGRKSIAAWPGYALAYRNLASPLCELMEQEQALFALEQAIELDPENEKFLGEYIFVVDLATSTTLESAKAARRLFNERVVKPLLPDAPEFPNSRDLNRKIRVGYITSDFYQHSAAHTFGFLLQFFDKERFEVYAYGSVEQEDGVTQGFKESVTVYRDVNKMSDERIAQIIRDDQIDILVDLSGFTKGTHLGVFARRAAPVQVSGWGYATGTSLDCFDWFFSDAICVPPDEEYYYAERVWRLPTALSWIPPSYLVTTSPAQSAFGRPFTFGCFSRQHKITRESMEAWCEILRQAPMTRLILKNACFDLPDVFAYYKDFFKEQGVYYANNGEEDKNGKKLTRIGLFGKTNHADHMAAHWPIDLMLDPFPHGNGVSAFESLWMGVPMLTLHGDRISGRIASSILQTLELDAFVASSVEDYIERAVKFASMKPIEYARYRHGLNVRKRLGDSIMMNGPAYTKAVEDAYLAMLTEWAEGTGPTDTLQEAVLQETEIDEHDLLEIVKQ